MRMPRFLQIHTLHAHPIALINRDESNFAKRMPMGGAVRTRVASQSLKRHWRMANDEYSLRNIPGATSAIRSRNIINRMVIEPMRGNEDYSEEVLDAVQETFNAHVYSKDSEKQPDRQTILMGLPEIEYLTKKATDICNEHPTNVKDAVDAVNHLFNSPRGESKNFHAFLDNIQAPAGIEGAAFGRLITSDTPANIEGAVHVTHSFTVHREETETDYFSSVDDLHRDGDKPGASHLGYSELTSGIFYGYLVIDVPTLVSNLEGCQPDDWESYDHEMTAYVIRNLAHLIAKVSPAAKLGSTAAYAQADFMMIEAASVQPRTLGGAFRVPCAPTIKDAVEKLAEELQKKDRIYGVREQRAFISSEPASIQGAESLTMDELALWAPSAVLNMDGITLVPPSSVQRREVA